MCLWKRAALLDGHKSSVPVQATPLKPASTMIHLSSDKLSALFEAELSYEDIANFSAAALHVKLSQGLKVAASHIRLCAGSDIRTAPMHA